MSDPSALESKADRILLVDDDLQLVRGLKKALEHYGYRVRVVERGAQAPEAAAQFRPDLILLDVMMPGVDGWDVLGRLRGNPETESVPVIMLTGSSTDSAKVRGFSLGADDYVTKPFNLQELRCRVEAVLRRTKPREGLEPEGSIPVLSADTTGYRFLKIEDVYFAEGVRNYTYVHAYDSRYLSRLSLGALDERHVGGLMRVHRSFIVNMAHVRGCGWVNKSSFRLRLSDLARTEIPVSRARIPEVQKHLGLRE